MGMFDDLIPAAPGGSPKPSGGGMFDDLVPQNFAVRYQQDLAAIRGAAPKVGKGEAFGRGTMQGATFNFSDELKGLQAAGQEGLPEEVKQAVGILEKFLPQAKMAGAGVGLARYLGDRLGLTGGEAEQAYDTAAGIERAKNREGQEQQPGATLAGNLVGSLAVPVPGGAAASVGGRLASAGGAGAVTGLLAGIGEGEGAADTVKKGATGLALGGAIGAGSVPAVALLEKGGRAVAQAVRPATSAVRGLTNVDAEAARRIAQAQARDAGSAAPGMTQAEFAARKAVGDPVVVGDIGNETTQALARSAANTSPEGRAALEAVTGERYATQQPRVVQFLKDTFQLPEAGPTLDKLQDAARAANRPAYAKAYAQGQGLWDDGLEQLSQAPVVQQAIRLAFVTGRNRDTLAGFPPLKNPFSMNNDTGHFQLAEGATPNLQFWDHVKRNLDKLGAEGQAFSRALRDHLDDAVPAYKEARSGAAKFFGAEDALEAGAKFATMSGRDSIKLHEARQALSKMGDAERKLFETGFVSNLIGKIESAREGQDVVKAIFSSETAKQQIRLALGDEKAAQLEAKLLSERAMNGLKIAIQGNSTTARQWIERGMAGGASTLGGLGTYNSDPTTMTTAALVGALTFGAKKIDQRVARRVGEMLASDDAGIIQKGVDIIAKSQRMRDAFRALDVPFAKVGGSQAPNVPLVQAAGIGRADEQEQGVPRRP